MQGQSDDSANKLYEWSLELQEAGCFSIVLECIPSVLTEKITQALSIATIGIGAGPFTDGQVLVYQDLLGLQTDFKPKFLKVFVDGFKYLSS